MIYILTKINSLELYYQPKVDTFTLSIVSTEALCRFKDKNNNILNTLKIIEEIEFNHMQILLTSIIIKQVILDLEKIYSSIGKYINVSINISAYEMEWIHFEKWICSIFQNKEHYCNYIEFELTERCKPTNINTLNRRINFLHSMGFKVSLDDLIFNYYNFMLLTTLKFDIIKLDKSILYNMDKNISHTQILITAIQAKNILIVAEGVESDSDYKNIKNLSCDYIQGYYFYEPLRIKELISNLK